MDIERANKNIVIASITKNGAELGRKIYKKLMSEIDSIELYAKSEYIEIDKEKEIYFPLQHWMGEQIASKDVIIAIMASGIVVRSIAPFIKHKAVDPAVIVIDEGGNFVISLLSGHIGCANQISKYIANSIGATAVITTASDIQNKKAVDIIAMENKLIIGDLTAAKDVTAFMVNDKAVYIIDKDNYIKKELNLKNEIPLDKKSNTYGIIEVSNSTLTEYKNVACRVKLIPQNIVVGIGFRKEKTASELIAKVKSSLDNLNIDIRAIKNIATVPIKAEQAAYTELVAYFKCEEYIVSYEKIKEIENRFECSELVEKTLGIGCVAEPCAYIASDKGLCLLKKTKMDGVTISIYQKE